jgi:hypothetical protein
MSVCLLLAPGEGNVRVVALATIVLVEFFAGEEAIATGRQRRGVGLFPACKRGTSEPVVGRVAVLTRVRD